MSDFDPVGRPVDPMPVARAAGLRQLQREQRQKRRKQVRLAIAGAFVALVAVVAGAVLLGGGGDEEKITDDKRTQTTLLLMTTEPGVQGLALGMQELAIGIMPFSSLVVGAIAQRIGVGATTQGCAFLLAASMVVLAFRVPEVLRYSGRGPVQAGQVPAVDVAPS